MRKSLATAGRIVVKVGSGVLVGADYCLDKERIGRLVGSLCRFLEEKRQLVLVTSGAVAAGAPVIDLSHSPKTIPQQQACAAIGQNLLMSLYERLFSRRNRHTAQILLTRDDMYDRERYINAKNTLETLLSAGIVPIINENDSVAVNELKFGDNDQLSAQVAALVQADLLLILSTVEGFFRQVEEGTPERGLLLSTVERITDWHFQQTRDTHNSQGITRGGMRSKLKAIRKAADLGIPSILVSGLKDGILETVLEGSEEGTLFLPVKQKLSARKHWIFHSLEPKGSLVVDRGAVRALEEQGKSLLSIGITAVEGEFHSGNPVRVLGPERREIARGLSYYSSTEVEAILGCGSEEIRSRLGYSYYDEVIHRDNLVLSNIERIIMLSTLTSLENDIVQLARRGREVSRKVAMLSTDAKNSLLENLAEQLSRKSAREELLAANARDLEAGAQKGLSGALLDRLKVDSKRMDTMILGLREVARLPDPVGVDRKNWTRPNGLRVTKRTLPLGVIGIIYEARPNVTIDAFALCFKAGNATLLKGGSEAIHSNRALIALVRRTLAPAGLADACQLVDTTDREAVSVLLQQEEFIDLVIPRGGEGLIRFVAEQSRIPVIKHYKGVCNIYVDQEADLDKALSIAENAKISRPAVCNAMENLLVHEQVAPRFLPSFAQRMNRAGVELRGDDRTREILPDVAPATEDDYHEEYLDLVLAVRVVSGLDEAVTHIEKYGSSHTEAIITENRTKGQAFLNRVNSSVVLVNASTRFADGGELGLGAEIGISTTRLHAYGPMGLESLVTEKFVIVGDGQIRN